MGLTYLAGRMVQGALISCFLATACNASETIYAQELIREALGRHHDAVALLIYAKRPNTQDYVDIASDDVRPVEPATQRQLAVFDNRAARVLADAANGQLRIEEPLRNVSGDTIGVLTAVFPHPESRRASVELRTADKIQQELSSRLSDGDNLFQPYPYNPKVSDRTYAQALVFKTMAEHPEALILAMHVVPLGGNNGLIIACNVGRIGMASEDDDMLVINTGKTTFKAMVARSRFKVQLALQDSEGRTVGALSEFFRYESGAPPEHYEAMARKIRDELKNEIPDKAALFKSETSITRLRPVR